MPDHKDYQSAMDKVAPSEDWKAATLQKMAAARAQQERLKAAPRLRVAKKVGVPLAAAAAVALLAVPAALQSGLFAASGGTAAPSAALYSAACRTKPSRRAPRPPCGTSTWGNTRACRCWCWGMTPPAWAAG